MTKQKEKEEERDELDLDTETIKDLEPDEHAAEQIHGGGGKLSNRCRLGE